MGTPGAAARVRLFCRHLPILLIDEGTLRRPALDAHGLDDEDLKEAARLSHGLTDVKEVRQATLERDGKISIVPWRGKRE